MNANIFYKRRGDIDKQICQLLSISRNKKNKKKNTRYR